MTHPTSEQPNEIDQLRPVGTHAERPAKRSEDLTLRIPKPNWQVVALLLVALIAGFQTFQLARLKNNVSAKTVAATTAPQASGATASTSTASSDLQSQVGGC